MKQANMNTRIMSIRIYRFDWTDSEVKIWIPLLRVFYIASFSKNSFESSKYEYPYYGYYKHKRTDQVVSLKSYEYPYYEY